MNWCCVSEGLAVVKALGVELYIANDSEHSRCVVGLEKKLVVGFEEVDGQVSLTVKEFGLTGQFSTKRMEANAFKVLVEREKSLVENEKAEKRITDQAKAAGFVMGSSVCSLFGSTVYDGKVTSIDAQTELSVTFSNDDVKQYTIEQLREAIQVGKEAREKAAREKAAKEKAAKVSFFFC